MVVSLCLLAGGCGGMAGGMFGATLSGALAGGAARSPWNQQVSPLVLAETLGGAEGMPQTRVLAMDCGGQRVVLSVSDTEAWRFLPAETLRMQRFYFGDGLIRFGHGHFTEMNPVAMQETGRRRGDFKFDWLAVLTKDGIYLEENESRIDCQIDRQETPFEAAKLGGADFRALGNEPGWELVIWWDRMRLVYDYGASEMRVAVAGWEPLVEGDGGRFRGAREGRSLEAVLRPGPCHDSMSGRQFETRVEISLDGRTFQGCGKALH